MTWRRLGLLIGQLPRESATARARTGPDAWWSDTEYLLAMAVDALNAANWQRSADPKKPQPLPSPVPRPKDTARALAQAEETRRRLVEFRDRRRRELGQS